MGQACELAVGTTGSGGGHVQRLPVGPAEADHGGASGRNGMFRQQAPIRRVALDTATLEQGRPVAAFSIHRGTVGAPAVCFGGLEMVLECPLRPGLSQ